MLAYFSTVENESIGRVKWVCGCCAGACTPPCFSTCLLAACRLGTCSRGMSAPPSHVFASVSRTVFPSLCPKGRAGRLVVGRDSLAPCPRFMWWYPLCSRDWSSGRGLSSLSELASNPSCAVRVGGALARLEPAQAAGGKLLLPCAPHSLHHSLPLSHGFCLAPSPTTSNHATLALHSHPPPPSPHPMILAWHSHPIPPSTL